MEKIICTENCRNLRYCHGYEFGKQCVKQKFALTKKGKNNISRKPLGKGKY